MKYLWIMNFEIHLATNPEGVADMGDDKINLLCPVQRCCRCNVEKATTRENFGTKKNGLPRAQCRQCRRELSREYGAKNIAERRDRARKRRASLQRVGVVNEHLRYREALLKAQRNRCYFCKNQITIDSIEIDHLTPISRGGTNEYSNLAGCCAGCNKAKATRTEAEFIEWRRERLTYYG